LKRSLKKYTILIIDDDIDLGHMLTFLLKSEYEVGVVHTLKDAEVYLGSHNPICIFLDKDLPDGNGIQFIPKLISENKKAKIIMMTSDDTILTRQLAIQKGAIGFLAKPFSSKNFHNIIASVLIA